MSAPTKMPPAVSTVFSALIDYAGLFPPAALAMRPAVAEYVAARRSTHAWLLGRFIVPASRLGELIELIPTPEEPLALSVIVDANLEPREWMNATQELLASITRVQAAATQVRVESLEVPLPRLLSRRETYDATIGQFTTLAGNAGLRHLPIYVEFPRDERFRELLTGTLGALARARLRAKLRCGGTTADAIPSVEDVAAFIHTCVDENVPFKATAGLHHAVRHRDETSGFVMHGFLNILSAATFARRMGMEELVRVVAEEDAAAFEFGERQFRWREATASIEELAAMREHACIAYGSCSVEEPVKDLTALGILAESH